jgi:adenylate cyclase class IV
LFLYQNSRIHLDRVQGLGAFIEFEVPVTRGKKQARSMMNKLRETFRIRQKDIRGGSYRDLLSRRKMKGVR